MESKPAWPRGMSSPFFHRWLVVDVLMIAKAFNNLRMLGSKGNPQAQNLFEVIAQLQKTGGIRLELALKRS